jgi:hypothetical protein
MCKLFFHCVIFVLLSFQAFAGKSDSSRYYFKLSGNVGAGLESFKYSSSHYYSTSYRHNNYSYSGSLKSANVVAKKYNAELKFDVELPLGIKLVNGLSYNSASFETPTYAGGLSYENSANPIYTYNIKEKISCETAGVFLG